MNPIVSVACAVMLLGISWAAQTPAEKEIPEKNPFDSAADVAAGRQYFVGHCALCHGPDGEGGRGINLTAARYRMGGSDRELFRTIQKGVPESEMPGHDYRQPDHVSQQGQTVCRHCGRRRPDYLWPGIDCPDGSTRLGEASFAPQNRVSADGRQTGATARIFSHLL